MLTAEEEERAKTSWKEIDRERPPPGSRGMDKMPVDDNKMHTCKETIVDRIIRSLPLAHNLIRYGLACDFASYEIRVGKSVPLPVRCSDLQLPLKF